jgi:hypothetical protein
MKRVFTFLICFVALCTVGYAVLSVLLGTYDPVEWRKDDNEIWFFWIVFISFMVSANLSNE